MDAEYSALALKIAAAYPNSFISDLTLADWTTRLLEADDLEHATRIHNRLRNLPSPPDPWDWRHAYRDTREVEYFRALPAGEVVDDRTPEEVERWESLKARLRERPIGRDYPKALDDVPDSVFTDYQPTNPRIRSCPGNGKVAVRIGGKQCCPDCGMPLDGSEPSSLSTTGRGTE